MALIKCPECNKEISDRATACIHCGYPLDEPKKSSECAQVQMDKYVPMWLFSEDDSNLNIECGKCKKVYSFSKRYFLSITNKYCISNSQILCPNCKNTTPANVKIERKIEKKPDRPNNNNSVLKCRRCGSTSVTVGTRGYSLLWGFIGSGKTTNRCGKCGYTWQP